MKAQIFINLPVNDLKKSMEFYGQIGFTNNPQFTDDTAACMALTDEIFVMLLTHAKFREFTTKQIIDAKKDIEVINSLSLESNAKVDEMMTKVLKAGGTEASDPKDYGFMWLRSFNDLDGHRWELLHMDMSKFPQQ